MATQRVIVVGAGIVGLATATLLAEAGFEVTVIDRHSGPAQEASGDNGAQLSYSYTEPMASPAILRELVKIARGASPGLSVSAPRSLSSLVWYLAFLRNCNRADYERSTLAALRLAQRSRVVLHQLLERFEPQFEYAQQGKLILYFDERRLLAQREMVARKRKAGDAQRIVTTEEAIAIEPSLSGLRGSLSGAVFSPTDESGDCRAFCVQLTEYLRSAEGVTFCFDTEVKHLLRRKGRIAGVTTPTGDIASDLVVICGGGSASDLVRQSGSRATMPVRGYSVTIPAIPTSPTVSLTDTSQRIVFCRLGERVRIAGVADVNGAHDASRTSYLLAAARKLLPLAGDYAGDCTTWSGARPATPSSLPWIGRAREEGLYVNMGHGMLGWTLAFGSAEVLLAKIEQKG
jgi:D-amino-acid dehydrogenase